MAIAVRGADHRAGRAPDPTGELVPALLADLRDRVTELDDLLRTLIERAAAAIEAVYPDASGGLVPDTCHTDPPGGGVFPRQLRTGGAALRSAVDILDAADGPGAAGKWVMVRRLAAALTTLTPDPPMLGPGNRRDHAG